MSFSNFGNRFSQYSAITHLMDDLSEGLSRDDMIMLGGGNPAAIPEVIKILQDTAQHLLDNGQLIQAFTNYDASQGKVAFLESLAEYFNRQYGWNITRENIALTHGSQAAFFSLFNSFGGTKGQSKKHVLLPITPEYIGYSDLGIEDDLFVSHSPIIESLPDRMFKYHIDFNSLDVNTDTGLICVSRPTNPSGNVLTDKECARLDLLAQSNDVPLLIDNAYGTPFPNIIFSDVSPFWNENTIVSLSLSKLGLPGVRTGIVVANKTVIKQLSNITAITSLAPGGTGPAIVNELLVKQQLTSMCDDIIRPFYQERCDWAVNTLKQVVNDDRLHIHLPEGAIFLWLWFEGLSITTSELYQHLKQAGLLVVPGKYFFPGQDPVSEHAESCIRMNYVQSKEDMLRGIEILAKVLRRYWA